MYVESDSDSNSEHPPESSTDDECDEDHVETDSNSDTEDSDTSQHEDENTDADGTTSVSKGSPRSGNDSKDEGSTSDESSSSSSSSSSPSNRRSIPAENASDLEDVWELCCSPDSNLVQASQTEGLVCRRLTLPRFDFRRKQCFKRARAMTRTKKPKKLWVSVPCKAYSALQNMRRKRGRTKAAIKASAQALKKERKETDLITRHCLDIVKVCLERDPSTMFYKEWPRSCHGWRHCKPLQHFGAWLQMERIPVFRVRVDACCWGLLNMAGTKLMSKSRIMALIFV